VRALRVVTVQRGIDPRRYALLAFGGAGGLHAAAIAEELGMNHVVCPRASGVLAALGLVVSPRRRDVQRSVFLAGDALTADAVAEAVAALGEQARSQLGDPAAQLRAVYETRYRGQAFELAVAAPLALAPEELRECFEALHEERYGYRDAEGELELVTVRVTATAAAGEMSLQPAEANAARSLTRAATIGGERLELAVTRGAPPPGTRLCGPAAVDLPESTLLVAPGWAGDVDEHGSVHLWRQSTESGGADAVADSAGGRT
jgi:N-methylhydantoinase A